jgi:hypothetical protein
VPFDKILDSPRDGILRIEQKFSSDGKFISATAVGAIFGKEIGENEKLKGFSFNGQSYSVVVNNYYNVNVKTESKSANWKMTLSDNSVIELCVDKFPKVLVLDKVEKPTKDKDWDVIIDITNNEADEIILSDNSFFSEFFSYLLYSELGTSQSFNVLFPKEDVILASEEAKSEKEKDFTIYLEASKSYLKTINGKKINIVITNTTLAKYPVF